MAARDSEQRPQSILSLAERSDTKIMSMYKELSVKSRVRGDFHARFCERVRVKLPRSTRPMTLIHNLLGDHYEIGDAGIVINDMIAAGLIDVDDNNRIIRGSN